MAMLLSTDLDKITGIEAWKLVTESLVFLYGEGLKDARVGRALDHGAHSMEFKLAAKDPVDTLKKIQSILRDFLELLIQYKEGQLEELPLLQTQLRTRRHEDSIWLEHAGPASEATGFALVVFDLISDVGLEALSRCHNEPCQIPFLKTAHREKVFCTQRCASQQGARLKRRTTAEKKKRAKAKREKYNWKEKQHGEG
jgi:hypothetical protein